MIPRAILIALLSIALWGCTPKSQPPVDQHPPTDLGPRLDQSRVSTTQISQNLADTKEQADINSKALEQTATTMQKNVEAGRVATPAIALKDLAPIWNNISSGISQLWIIKGLNDRVSEQIKAQKQQIDMLTQQIEKAQEADRQLKAYWAQREKDLLKQIGDRDTKIAELDGKLKDSNRAKLWWLIVAAIGLAGVSVFIAAFSSSKIGVAGVLGSGTVIIICLIVTEVNNVMNEVRWMFPWMLGIVFVLAIGYIVWLIVTHRLALFQTVQAMETVKDEMPSDKRFRYFGNFARLGVFEDRFYWFTKRIIEDMRRFAKKARPALITPIGEPEDAITITDGPNPSPS